VNIYPYISEYISLYIGTTMENHLKKYLAMREYTLQSDTTQEEDFYYIPCEKKGLNIKVFMFKPKTKVEIQKNLKAIKKKINKTDHILIVVDKNYISDKSKKTKIIDLYKDVLPNNTVEFIPNIFDIFAGNNILIPKHTICSDEEVADLLEHEKLASKTCLPKIFSTDPQVVMLQAKEGDVIKIERCNQYGYYDYYRLVI